jgi:hypothetical protein
MRESVEAAQPPAACRSGSKAVRTGRPVGSMLAAGSRGQSRNTLWGELPPRWARRVLRSPRLLPPSMLAPGPINRGSDTSDGPPWPSTRASSFLAFRAGPSPLFELSRHEGPGGRKLASKARRRRALTVVYPPRNKSPLTTSLLSNWPSTQSEGWRSGSLCPPLDHRLALRLVVPGAGVDRHALVASRRGNEP